MMLETLRQFVGTPPVGLEWLEYYGALLVFLLLFRFVTDMFRILSNIFKIKF